MYDGSWESIWLINAITKIIIEKGYGYPVETREEAEAEMIRGLKGGSLDLVMELWDTVVFGSKGIADKKLIINLGMTFESGAQFWIIPNGWQRNTT